MKPVIVRVGALLLALLASAPLFAAAVTRGPYLQLQTESSITLRWRTDIATDSVVRFGLTAGNLNQSVTVAGTRTEHKVRLGGLTTGQQYFYSVGDSIAPLAGDASYHFHTAPARGLAAETRIWVIGDSGTADANAVAVRNAYTAFAGANPADFWLMLGDNAYNDGTDAEYQAAVFNIYPQMLRQMPVWSTLGNHDGHTADSATQTGPYYDIFDMPKAAEAGGLASGTEAYYSFDYGNIHFICLDSYDTSRALSGAMMQWLEADLAVNTQPWVIAFWHHPPYTKGSHNSDTESQLIDMRQNALPLLEAWGVDLVLTGHSHSYERSYLLDGHYGASTTLDPVNHVLDPGDGRVGGFGAYEKPALIAAQNAGAVYAVAGSSGKISGGALNHPAMFVSLNSLGSMVLDVSGDRLEAVFIDQAGTVRDSFTLQKTPDFEPPLLAAANAEDATHVLVDFNETVDSTTAGNAANYSIGGLSVSAAQQVGPERVRLTTSTMTNGAAYTLSVSNVKDLSGNAILPGSTIGFTFNTVTTISFQDGLAPDPGYTGTRDAYIRQATATTAYGLQTSLQMDGDEPAGTGTDMNIVLAFDLAQIPVGAIVESANIRFEVTNISTGSYTCYGLLRPWVESETTWNRASTATAWGGAGATSASDRDSTPLCTVNAASLGALTVSLNTAGIARLQAWVDTPSTNHGIVIANPATTDGADFHSSESATALARPKLTLTYRVNAPPPNNAPVASYLYDCNALACNFSNTSTDSDGSVVAWAWNFGDGSTSTAQNPSHSFSVAGNYNVSLTVTDDDGGSDSEVMQVVALPPNNPPAASFQYDCNDLDCTFADTSIDSDGTLVAWAWNFGDGSTSSAQNPAHSFAAAGDYSVSLTVTDDDGHSGNMISLISVSSAGTVSFDPDSSWPLCGRITVNPPQGWQASNGCPAEYFGDANHSDEPLSATFGPRPLASGNNRYDFHRGIDIATPTGTPFFAIADGVVRIAGVDSGYSDPLVSLRHFRPGETSCSNLGCYNSLYLHISEWVVSEGQNVSKGQLLGYTGVSDSGFEHLHFELRDAPASDPFSSWSRDAIHPLRVLPYSVANNTGITFNAVDLANAATVDLTLISNRFDLVHVDLTLLDEQQQPVPQPGRTPNSKGYNVLPPFFDMESANFQYSHKNSSGFPWSSFGAGGVNQCPYYEDHGPSYDATVHLDAQHPDDFRAGLFNGIHVRTQKYWPSDVDNYEVQLEFLALEGPASCVKATALFASGDSKQAQWGNCGTPPPNNAPAASFQSDCTDLDCSFSDTSTDSDGTVVAWDWDFGDGSSSTTQNPSHSFAVAGNYNVSLTVTDDDGASDSEVMVVVALPPNNAPAASFQHNCSDLDCNFSDSSADNDGSIVAWAWNFGDGTTSTAQNPSHSFADAGVYTISLTVTDDDGATSASVEPVTVTEPPPGPQLVFSDSFENGAWGGLWAQDTQNDWYISKQRGNAGANSAEVDGPATDAQLVSVPIDLQGLTAATITFNWYIESGLDSGEYIAFDVSTNGGVAWTQRAILRGNVDPENVWHPVQVNLDGISALKLRFRARMSASDEDANVDAINVMAAPGSPVPPAPQELFNDSFEFGAWAGLWTQDSQNDWYTSTQRATAGTVSAEVDGGASDAQLISVPIDLKGQTTVRITFNWLIESSLDTGEYIAFDVSTNGGTGWTQQAILRGNVDPENAWRPVQVDLAGIGALRLRFRARMSGSDEDANVDAISVIVP